MGIFDSFGNKKELEKLAAQVNSLKDKISKTERNLELQIATNVKNIDHTHNFLGRLKQLVGTLEDEHVISRTWELLNMVLTIKKGGIFAKTENGWIETFSTGFVDDAPPIIPIDEESMATAAEKFGTSITISYLRKQDDIAYLERRGVIPDTKIVCPIRIEGQINQILIICSYGGNVFQGENDISILEMITTVLGLVLTNSKILSEQKLALDNKSMELNRVRNLFASMVAPEVISYIEQNPGGISLGGKRQKVAVLFADIRGFTSLSEKSEPEQVIDLLNKFFTRLTDVVISEKGTLDKFMGDAAMVLFGTPVVLENPCLNAVKAAVKIQETVALAMPGWVAEGYPKFTVGVGINYQEVVMGNVGSERLSNFTAIGDGVNIASRLCSLAGGNQIIVSESVYFAVADNIGEAEKKTGVMVKGKEKAITVYSLIRGKEFKSNICSKCGSEVSQGTRFCGGCGFKMF